MKIVKINLSNMSRYKKCIAAQAQVEQIESLLDEIKFIIDGEAVFDDEWATYTLTAKKSMLSLARILNERAKTYVEEGVL